MYRIILIDDEPQIRHGLSNLIIWDELGIELVGEASNGQEALELIEKVHPHIAISDIQMQVMDGLELLKAAKGKGISTKFIMLSGFNQFDYVRTSLTLGACNYLLKPVNEAELKNTLQETIIQIDDEAAKKQQFDESMSALFNNTLNRLLTNRIDVRELGEKCGLLDITLRCNSMAVGIIKPIFNNADTEQRHIMFESLDYCKQYFKSRINAYCVADAMDNVAIIFKDPDGTLSNDLNLKMLAECAAGVQGKIGPNCVFALCSDASSFKELPASYQDALHKVDMKMLWGDSEDIRSLYDQDDAAPIFDVSEIQKKLSTGELDEFSDMVLNNYMGILAAHTGSDLMTIKLHTVELVSQILNTASKCYIADSDLQRLKNDIFARIKETKTAGELQSHIESFIASICSLSDSGSSCSYSQNVALAVNYIIKNYGDSNLSLKTLANQLGINSAYLGRLFNMETGMFFSDYLNNHRTKEARKLLSETSMKVADVASAVGFSNVSYFNTIYKKITGERPRQRSM